MTETRSPAAGAGAPPARALDELLPGRVIRPGDERYGAARTLWNAMIDHRPTLIVQPQTADEVAIAIFHARDAGLEIAVRGGGHSIAGHSMSDGGMTIDLSALNRVAVDPPARRARVGGGALLTDVASAAAPVGLAFPFGHVSHTGVGGLTLGGGIGWIMRKHGLAVDSLHAAELVTAEGAVVRASESENPELFWALRGGGGNFGVVTEFEFELHPFGPEALAGMVLHPLENAGAALRFSRDFMDEAPAELTVFETFTSVPPQEPFPVALRGKPALALGMVYAGAIADALAAVEPLRRFGPPALDLLAPMPYVAVQTMLDPTAPHGMRNYNKAHWLGHLPDTAIDDLVERHATVPSPMSLIINARMGGAIEDVPANATAFAHRDAYRLLWAISAWWEGEDDEHIEWCRGVFDAMSPHSTGGVYVNTLGDEGSDRVRASYGEATWRRLVAVKARWDPDNVFHLNQNIAPAGDAVA
jgi:FAD/FMN-containing dehydrogenase